MLSSFQINQKQRSPTRHFANAHDFSRVYTGYMHAFVTCSRWFALFVF